MSTTHDIPDYSAWARDDLITETTRLALEVGEAENRGWDKRAVLCREKYHQAMAALIALSTPFDRFAARRAEATREGHLIEAARLRRERLGVNGEVPA
ncbi:hypothetical protein SAMN05661010_02544 [Modicisalibacter muralis]|uniref:Uncharacterized protein n=1 Tax=Modicisalibacter muralis TaxID=119000 RepID=A0A1G9MW33_9GAMM|nr:hypothetical protein [Halomonas muralis]SDL78438.1 hypothetical protein SAMN05661010_02544 [Halomonas muralis]